MKRILLATLLSAIAFSQSVYADTYSFTKITNNNPENLGSQLLLDVTNGGGSNVIFTFYNNVGIASSITDIYFDDVNPTGIFSNISVYSDSGAGVSFSDNATPSNLPGGNAIGFSADFSGDSNAPVSSNGVNAMGEWVSFIGVLSGSSFNDIISNLNSGGFTVGLHVQAIGAQGGSDGYISTPLNPVPVPGAVWLFASALFGFVATTRRSRL